MIKIAPSILTADFSDLRKTMKILDESGVDLIHLDVMDGHFVPNITFGPVVIKSIRNFISIPFDVHLMIENPDYYIDDFVDAGADIITVHVEACRHLHRTIQRIKSHNIKAAVALNPATPLSSLDYILDDIDMVLLMSVNPGFGGQSFIPQILEKIKTLRKIIDDRKLNIDLEVDGGIKLENLPQVVKAGANVIVAGSAIINSDDIRGTIGLFKNVIENIK